MKSVSINININETAIKNLFTNLKSDETMYILESSEMRHEDLELPYDAEKVVECGVRNIVTEPQMFEYELTSYDLVGMVVIESENGTLTTFK